MQYSIAKYFKDNGNNDYFVIKKRKQILHKVQTNKNLKYFKNLVVTVATKARNTCLKLKLF